MVQRWNEDDKPKKKAVKTFDPATLTPLARTCGSIFALMKPGGEGLTFHMVESKPTEQMQKGLDELVEKGFVERKGPPHKYSKAITYVPLTDMFNFRVFASEVTGFNIAEPIKKEKKDGKRKS